MLLYIRGKARLKSFGWLAGKALMWRVFRFESDHFSPRIPYLDDQIRQVI
jgi:hypothetical protein